MTGPRWCAVVVAAGRGTRFGRPKQLVEIAGRPMLAWSVAALATLREVEQFVVTTEADNIEAVAAVVRDAAAGVPFRVVAGGAERQDSVRRALETLADGTAPDAFVLIHDGARPMVAPGDVRRGMEAATAAGAALLAVRVVDTIKEVDAQGKVLRTHDRERLWSAQTPQFGRLHDLLRAHRDAHRAGVRVTDDAALLERSGVDVVVVEGSSENFKVTVPSDLERAALILRERAAI